MDTLGMSSIMKLKEQLISDVSLYYCVFSVVILFLSACGINDSQPGVSHPPPLVTAQILTTGPPGSQVAFFAKW